MGMLIAIAVNVPASGVVLYLTRRWISRLRRALRRKIKIYYHVEIRAEIGKTVVTADASRRKAESGGSEPAVAVISIARSGSELDPPV